MVVGNTFSWYVIAHPSFLYVTPSYFFNPATSLRIKKKTIFFKIDFQMWRLSLGISHTLVLIEQNKILYKILKVFQWVIHCKLWSFRRHKQIKKTLWNLVKPRWKCKQMTVLLDFYHVFFNGMEQSHNFFNRRGSSTMEIFFWNGDVRGKIPGIFFLNTVEIMIILITWTSFLYSQCFSVCREKWIVFLLKFSEQKQ